MGLARAGFDVTGVDILPQDHYPFAFLLADALEVPLEGYDAYWASPPCQHALWASARWRNAGRQYQNLVEPTRLRLHMTGKPYVIEQPMAQPLHNPVRLCGSAFGLGVVRHRWFETGNGLAVFGSPCLACRGAIKDGRAVTVAGHGGQGSYDWGRWCTAMGIDWMRRDELIQAIPPVYAEFVGKYLMAEVLKQRADAGRR